MLPLTLQNLNPHIYTWKPNKHDDAMCWMQAYDHSTHPCLCMLCGHLKTWGHMSYCSSELGTLRSPLDPTKASCCISGRLPMLRSATAASTCSCLCNIGKCPHFQRPPQNGVSMLFLLTRHFLDGVTLLYRVGICYRGTTMTTMGINWYELQPCFLPSHKPRASFWGPARRSLAGTYRTLHGMCSGASRQRA